MTDSPLFPVVAMDRLRMGTDGRGVTTLVVGKGCPLRCKYCLNPFSWDGSRSAVAMTARELYDKVRIDDLYFQATGGGVTFGGGEPLLHTGFIRAFRALCGEVWRITVETSLNVPADALRTATACVDEFIVDVKDMNPDIYHRYTGAGNERVLDNLGTLLQAAGPERVWVRVPHIPSFNTSEDVARSISQLRAMGVARFDEFEYVCHC